MTLYIDTPDAGPMQGIWGSRPRQDDWPNDLCDHLKEGITITDLPSTRRFFREKCRWSWRALRGMTAVVFLEGQTWPAHPTIVWPIARRGADEHADTDRGSGAPETSGGDISARLRHAVHQVTVADFPASWQAASVEKGRAPRRSHDARPYGTRHMLRLDEVSLGKLDALTQVFLTSRAEVIRQLIMQATPKVFPQSWHMAAAERRARLVRRQGWDLA